MPQGYIPTFVSGALKHSTYRVADLARSAYASTQDMWQLLGSATKKVRLRRVRLCGRATAAAQLEVAILKRSSVNSGGTITALTNISYDSAIAAPTAVPSVITAAPTFGTLQGAVDMGMMFLAAAGTISANAGAGTIDFNFALDEYTNGIQAPVLNNASESFVINFNTWTTVAGNAFDMMLFWDEQ